RRRHDRAGEDERGREAKPHSTRIDARSLILEAVDAIHLGARLVDENGPLTVRVLRLADATVARAGPARAIGAADELSVCARRRPHAILRGRRRLLLLVTKQPR